MNAIKNALKDIGFAIPRPILEAVFSQRPRGWDSRFAPVEPLEAAIEREVIRGRVLIDCNFVGGSEIIVPLENVPMVRTSDYVSVYRIPKKLTGGRSIVSALNITFSNFASITTINPYVDASNSQLLNVGQQLIDSSGIIPVTSTAVVQLVGENTVMVQDTTLLPSNVYLRCIVANDDNLNNIQSRSYPYISQLCIYAVKAYIWNQYIIRMDVAELYGGQALGRFKEIIDKYEEAEELYNTYLREKIRKVFFMNDNTSMTRLIRLVGAGPR